MSTASYCPNTPEEVQEMLTATGASSIDDLFRPIPPGLRARSFDLPAGMSEFEMLSRFEHLAGKNAQHLSHFVGGGYYDHLIPAAVDHLAGRAGCDTAHPPAPPGWSQGTR
ncbi:glycine dehydrogenase, partial [bacterium]|nr:glycine dehydrogenase [bacterium]